MAKKSVQHTNSEYDTLIVTVLDCSGSMSPRVKDVIGNYNWFVGEQKKIGRARISLYRFDTDYETIYEDKDINEVAELTSEQYFARGGTALFDAVGHTISAIDKIKNKPPKVIVAINTDGEENSSHKYNLEQIQELVAERTGNHDWQFVYLGAGLDQFARESHTATATAMNFANVSAFGQSAADYSWGTASYNRGVTNFRTGQSATVEVNNQSE